MNLRKIKFQLQLWDGVWSIPIAFVAFWAFGLLLQRIFFDPGDPAGAPGFYDPSFLQSAFYATAMQVFINTVVWLGIHFNWRGIKRYHKGRKDENLLPTRPEPQFRYIVTNESKEDFKSLQPWQRLALLFLLYSFLSVEWIIIWVHLK